MSRAPRLLQLIEILRARRRPISGQALADELGVSLRSLYRDIRTLQGEGVPIEGEAGVGYVMRPGLTLPPLNFDVDELDAVVLGLRFVERRLPDGLGDDASRALAKIATILPKGRSVEDVQLLVGMPETGAAKTLDVIRAAIRTEDAVTIGYRDAKGEATERTVWPVVVGFFGAAEVLAAWCELRQDFRNFRLDRIVRLDLAGRAMERRHRLLLADWRLTFEMDEDC
ncbi:YafY family transcriptional regulator [Jiella sp. MQZ9-1]|uniref:YafY family transcriptional regulator n=1 Tax=Jiella flava TaxID=2816857 RepID=A0A939FWU6_9HYPH|nr:YafY family protein [Jiella flava]MBO0662955.1 YafY family transcriptional regulator [Jiella flava]MCD2471285.1 YafY family transcriptional regulator [Jiella flava]